MSLKDTGTWRQLETEDPAAAATTAATPTATPTATTINLAELQMLQRADSPGGCGFSRALRNKLPCEIRSLVFDFSALRASGVVYTSLGLGFGPVKPGDVHRRELRLMAIACQDIARLQLRGGDRCDMGGLNKFSEPNGQCPALVQVLPNKRLTSNK